ncbi:MAG TPA: hypothetical protein VGM88_23400 [Kofleriaceae bacterium]
MIGEILVRRGLVAPAQITRAVADQRASGVRLCSLLVARGLLDADDAARALAEQHGIPGVLTRHLEQRDRGLAKRLPATFARGRCALPVGTTSGGDLVIAVRDPIDAAELEAVCESRVIVAVALAQMLEASIAQAYEPVPSESIDVDLDTGPIETGPIALAELALVDLDDARVAKDFSQSGIIGARGLSGAFPVPRPPSESDGSIELPAIEPPASFEEALVVIAAARSRDHAFDVALQYAPRRWKAALLCAIDRDLARGMRGYGGHAGTAGIGAAFALSDPTVMTRACETKRTVPEIPFGDSTGPAQTRLSRMLGSSFNLSAAPILLGNRVGYVLVAGDPIGCDVNDAAIELDRIAAALSDVCART